MKRRTYRAIYTVKFAGAVYALHSFQKKSKKAIQTPRQHVGLILLLGKVADLAHSRIFELQQEENEVP